MATRKIYDKGLEELVIRTRITMKKAYKVIDALRQGDFILVQKGENRT